MRVQQRSGSPLFWILLRKYRIREGTSGAKHYAGPASDDDAALASALRYTATSPLR